MVMSAGPDTETNCQYTNGPHRPGATIVFIFTTGNKKTIIKRFLREFQRTFDNQQ